MAGGRRSDLAVPGGVALAELVPDLARAVGLLDPAAAYAGYRVQTHGRRLRPDQGLREQGVGDGALLVVVSGADEPAPTSYDDLAEATAEVVDRQRPWRAADSRRALAVSGAAAVATAAGTTVAGPTAHVLGALGRAGIDPVALTAAVLTLVVLAGNALPILAVATGVARADRLPVDPADVERAVDRSVRVMVFGSTVVGALAVLGSVVVARSGVGAALAADCCLVLLLRARRQRAARLVLVDVGWAMLGLLAAAVTALAAQPGLRPALAASLAAVGFSAVVLSRVPAPPPALRARAADLLETAALVALAPLLLLVTDGLARMAGG